MTTCALSVRLQKVISFRVHGLITNSFFVAGVKDKNPDFVNKSVL